MASTQLQSHLKLLQKQNQLLKQMIVLKDQDDRSSADVNAQALGKLDQDLRDALTEVSTRLEQVKEPSRPEVSSDQRHQVAVSLLETAAAHRDLKNRITSQGFQQHAPTPQPESVALCLEPRAAETPPEVSAAEAVRTRYRSSSFSHVTGDSNSFSCYDQRAAEARPPFYHIPFAKVQSRSIPALSPPRRAYNSAKPPALPKKSNQAAEGRDDAELIHGMADGVDDGESLPGSPFWTEAMNIGDLPDGETSVYKDAEMKRMLTAWLIPRRSTKWCTGGCTLEQKVDQKRSRMRSPGSMFMMQCG
jgi:hypothetical protein